MRRMRLNFITPLRMRVEGQYQTSPSFIAIAQALLRRIHLLAALYGEGGPDSAWMHPLLAAADEVRTRQADFQVSGGWYKRAARAGGSPWTV